MNLPEEAQIHPIVHVSQLKRRLGTGEVAMERLPAVTEEGKIVFRPARALEYRKIKRSGRFRWEVLIEWESLATTEATWEEVDMIRQRFPNFVLEDKDVPEEDRNDANESCELKNAYNWARRVAIKATAQQIREHNIQASSSGPGK